MNSNKPFITIPNKKNFKLRKEFILSNEETNTVIPTYSSSKKPQFIDKFKREYSQTANFPTFLNCKIPIRVKRLMEKSGIVDSFFPEIDDVIKLIPVQSNLKPMLIKIIDARFKTATGLIEFEIL
jgi:hypothetical protein